MSARYAKADSLRSLYAEKVLGLQLEPNWFLGGRNFWYRTDLSGQAVYQSVDCVTGRRKPLFDAPTLDREIERAVNGPVGAEPRIDQVHLSEDGNTLDFGALGRGWRYSLAEDKLVERTLPRRPRYEAEPWEQNLWPADRSVDPSPDGKTSATIDGSDDVILRDPAGAKIVLATGTPDDYYARLEWSPHSDVLIAFRVRPGDRKSYMYLEESPPNGGPPILHKRIYDRPGDKIDTFHMELIDPVTHRVVPVATPPVGYGDMPDVRWTKDKEHFTFEAFDRGYSRFRVFNVDALTGQWTTVIDDHPATFVDSTSQFLDYLSDDSMVWRSEKDGWGQLYYVSPTGEIRNRITHGNWVVRTVLRVDEKKGKVIFGASGVHPGEDPYYIHYFSASLDGKSMIELTPELGNHDGKLSPDGDSLVDTFSTVQNPPQHDLRRVSDGALICNLGKADESALLKTGWKPPEPFVAKGRDGRTDIYGIVYRPRDYRPDAKYPIVEDIYAGPQDSFVPKSFRSYYRDQALAELGFVVVQIDGMGTRNRSKAFHDVCYKNLKDAGFPDRILWMKALASRDHAIDLSRVGIFGTSAGGQNAAGALLFHPEFYKVGVASCGCHDNRLDKIWWNEQWMGYPVGPQYSESSNIDHASNLQGKLLLFVGEMDRNVPPESTFRFANALERAGKDFQLVIITGSDHTDGGAYGEHKRRDFFVKNLLHANPPAWK
jgi:dipeptidyl aminopeptidase/acylaminoacyl peptidase